MATSSLNFSLSDKVLLSFFSFWYSHCICYNFFSYPIILEYSVLGWVFVFVFPQSLSSWLFRFEDSIEIYSSFEIPSRAKFSLQISPSKAFFISVTVFFNVLHFFLTLSQEFCLSVYIAYLILHAGSFIHLSR